MLNRSQTNGCNDPCRHSNFLWPLTLFRSYLDLQLSSIAETSILNSYLVPETLSGSSSFFAADGYIGTVVGAFVLSQGIWALCFGRKSPRQARETVSSFFLRLSTLAAPIPGGGESEKERLATWDCQVRRNHGILLGGHCNHIIGSTLPYQHHRRGNLHGIFSTE